MLVSCKRGFQERISICIYIYIYTYWYVAGEDLKREVALRSLLFSQKGVGGRVRTESCRQSAETDATIEKRLHVHSRLCTHPFNK